MPLMRSSRRAHILLCACSTEFALTVSATTLVVVGSIDINYLQSNVAAADWECPVLSVFFPPSLRHAVSTHQLPERVMQSETVRLWYFFITMKQVKVAAQAGSFRPSWELPNCDITHQMPCARQAPPL